MNGMNGQVMSSIDHHQPPNKGTRTYTHTHTHTNKSSGFQGLHYEAQEEMKGAAQDNPERQGAWGQRSDLAP